jgi:lipoprotein-releasing system ATP-binding protein
MSLLQATGIHKKFGQLEVLKGVDLSLAKSEIVSIVGPSGSGKSTLLHILGTLDRPDSGRVALGNTELTKLSGRRLAELRNRRIGFVFQFHHLLPEFSAIENVSIPAWIGGRRRSAVRPEAERLLGLLGLGHRLDHKPGELSGGEQQRVAVARALIQEPRVVLADEPTGNLDPATAAGVQDLLIELNGERRLTLVVVTHSAALAGAMDRTLRLAHGHIAPDPARVAAVH